MLKHTTGNLIDLAEQGHFDIIIHGCNCQNTMGSGIAKELRSRYPEVYDADTTAASRGWNTVGRFSLALTQDKFYVVNAYTQNHYLPRGRDHFEYDAFKNILQSLSKAAKNSRIGLPYIGMGLAGGDPVRILNIIESFAIAAAANNNTVTLVEFSS